MHRIDVHQRINQIKKLFYLVGLWHSGDEPTVRETRVKWFYSIYYSLFLISLGAGAIMSDSLEESVFLSEAGLISAVFLLKLMFIIWKKTEILHLLDTICVYSTVHSKEFTLVNGKQNKFMNYVTAFLLICVFTIVCGDFFVSFVGDEKKLYINIGLPFDYKHNDVSFWIAFGFLFTQGLLAFFSVLFTILMWYLMFNCAIKYEVLGHQIKNLGVKETVESEVETTVNKSVISDTERHNLFYEDLIASIESHKHINELTSEMDSFLSYIFFAQIATSAMCICGSIYCIIFLVDNNYMEYLMHLSALSFNIFDIFMVMYFGNEIKLSSDQLSYCLFQSNWIDQSESTKKCVIIFGERLKQPYEIVVGKLYALTLETFQRILNSAYSMFSILQNLT